MEYYLSYRIRDLELCEANTEEKRSNESKREYKDETITSHNNIYLVNYKYEKII